MTTAEKRLTDEFARHTWGNYPHPKGITKWLPQVILFLFTTITVFATVVAFFYNILTSFLAQAYGCGVSL